MTGFITWDIDPQIFTDVAFLRWYGCCWAVGMMLGYQVLLKMYKQENLSQQDLDVLTIYVVLGTIIGARLGHILFYAPTYYLSHPIEILPIQLEPTFQFTGLLGLASHGGVVGALLAVYLYGKKHKKDLLWTLDRLTIAASLLGAWIRLGNLMNSEIIGIPTQVPWAFVFTRIDDIPRHPTQLYEALFYLLIFLFLFMLWKRKSIEHHKGFLFGLGLSLIFTQRFLMEFLKENQVAFEESMQLNMGQILSIPLMVIGLLTMLWSIKKFGAKHRLLNL
ncbi:MAG: prolipoprotein diacylglyceryl transferase [Cytophagia bacterium]|nr:prolipoprotein diacylglyceryl transferase [Cytophagia bacterium]